MSKQKNHHRPDRFGECWPQDRLDASLEELQFLREYVVISGGWAWHFMSPIGHKELKHAHDHKDIDLLVPSHHVAHVVQELLARGFVKTWTRYDRLPSPEEFRRYEKHLNIHGKDLRITIDFFVKDAIPTRSIDGWTVVDPAYLLTLYKTIHSSSTCFAAVAAQRLLAANIDPVGRPELVQIPK